MPNRIHHVEVTNRRLDPVEAVVEVTVVAERPAQDAEVRGRLAGPRCVYAETVEVAYPLRPAPGPHPSARAVLPEPCLWDPQSPFLYEGTVELWEGGERVDQVKVPFGLRDLRLGMTGLRVNGRPLA